MDVLLINSAVANFNAHAAMSPPLGLAYIGAVLMEAGYAVAAIDMNVTPMKGEELAAYLREARPAMIGISAYTETYSSAVNAARTAKAALPGVKVVIGGPHVSVLYAETAREGVFDAVERGEGELTNLELANLFLRGQGAMENIAGLAFMRDGELVVTPEREPIEDVDALPYPARDLFPLERYPLPVSLLTSRGGCPFSCDFCAVNNIWKGKRRFRSPERVMEELDYVLGRYKFDILNFSDDSFTLDKGRIMSLCAMIKERLGVMALAWQCATRVDLIDEELTRAMRAAGCVTIQFGVESGSQRILDSIGKRIRLEQVRSAVDLAHKYGIAPLCSFMFPHPEDTEETMAEQTELMRSLAEQGVALSLALTTPYPGTKVHRRREALGLRLLSDDWDDYDCRHLIVETKSFALPELEERLRQMVAAVGLHGSLG